MGTRADFYIGEGENAAWIGSIAYDGYPSGIDNDIFIAETETQYVDAVKTFFKDREDATNPVQGWPWPWEDSSQTDYAYAFLASKVYGSSFGYRWFDPLQDTPYPDFPDMKSHRMVTLGERSGCMFIK